MTEVNPYSALRLQGKPILSQSRVTKRPDGQGAADFSDPRLRSKRGTEGEIEARL